MLIRIFNSEARHQKLREFAIPSKPETRALVVLIGAKFVAHAP
jgi:hypothetical protein